MSNLYLKIGNSTNKALFKNKIYSIQSPEELKNFDFEKLIYYATNEDKLKSFESILNEYSGYKFENSRITLIKNDYKNKKQLGVDRLLGASYFYRKFKEDFIFIDLGTAITINIIIEKTFVGGYIIPGVNAYFHTLSTIGTLPHIKDLRFINYQLGKTTQSNIINGFYLLYNSFFDKINNMFKLDIFVSGGEKKLLKLIPYKKYVNNVDLYEMKNYEEI